MFDETTEAHHAFIYFSGEIQGRTISSADPSQRIRKEEQLANASERHAQFVASQQMFGRRISVRGNG